MGTKTTVEFSFSASGWLFVYQLGVAKALSQSQFFSEEVKGWEDFYDVYCTGSSGGSLVSTTLLAKAEIDVLKEFLLSCVEDCHANPKTNMFKMREYVKGAFEIVKEQREKKGLRQEFFSAEKIVQRKLSVSVTSLPNCKNHILSDFATQEELEEAILASCTMTPLAGFPFKLNRPHDDILHGSFVVDGGLSNIQPCSEVFEERQIKVKISSFSHWDVDIKPSQYVPVWWGLYPPSVEKMRQLFNLGLYDAQKWLFENSYRSKEPEPLEEELVDHHSRKVSGMKRSLSRLSGLGEDEVEGMTEEEFEYRMLDKFIHVMQKYAIKTVTVGAVYAEIWMLMSLSFFRGLIALVENQRREKLKGSNHILSIRRWFPETLIGSTADAMTSTKTHATNLFTLNPIKMWQHAGQDTTVKLSTSRSQSIRIESDGEEASFQMELESLSSKDSSADEFMSDDKEKIYLHDSRAHRLFKSFSVKKETKN